MQSQYQIKDIHSGETLTRVYNSRRAAQRAADRMDSAYGAVRYIVKFS